MGVRTSHPDPGQNGVVHRLFWGEARDQLIVDGETVDPANRTGWTMGSVI